MKPIKARLYFRVVEHYKVWHICYFDKAKDEHVKIAKIKLRKGMNKYSIKLYEHKYMLAVYEFLEQKQLFGFTDKQVHPQSTAQTITY